MTDFRVWAPRAEKVELDLGGERRPMARADRTTSTADDGWWELDAPAAVAGTDYSFRLDGGPPRPDPRSPRQPHGVHGPSRVTDPRAFPWTDAAWPGRALTGGVVYELHIGAFTPQGTFDAAAGKLDHLVDLGVDLVEVMPVAAFPGRHGWGYDGVALWAVHEPYGGPAAFQRFVDACHARGLGVLLDVVYNHLGPSGNYLSEFGPYFTDTHQTPWGAAVNLDGPGSDGVRAFIVGNALHWLRDFHLDGLRLDAVHALADTRALHILEELSGAVDALAADLGRPLHLIAESDRNDPATVTPRAVGRLSGGLGLHAQWNDDFHHALHSTLTGENQGYYADFAAPAPLAALAKTLRSGFFHDGTYSAFRARTHGRRVDTASLGADRFVAFLQNHDQVGNRALGDRIGATLSDGLARVGAALLLTSPFTPQLFMGEEWGAGTPWQYFTDHPEPDLARAVRDGRRAEFARHGWPPDQIPDPQAPGTFTRSVLDWSEPAAGPHRSLLAWYRALLALRRARPELSDPRFDQVDVHHDEEARWLVLHRGPLRVVANLAPHAQPIPLAAPVTAVLLASRPDITVPDSASPGPALRLAAECVAIVA